MDPMAHANTEAAYSIATLPKPLDVRHGRLQSAPAYSLRGSRKRKRHEIVVGIDGEALNVYNVQSQSLVTSYALPPQSFLCCPPCSIYCHQTKKTPAQRRTYVVTRDGFESKRQKLVCFLERSEVSKEGAGRPLAPVKSEHKLEAGDILGLEVLCSASDESGPSGVLVTYRDGETICVAPDLSGTVWSFKSDLEAGHARVDFTATFAADEALKGLLASREDVAAIVAASYDAATIRQLMLRLVIASDTLKLALFALRLPSQDGIQTQRPALTKIMEYDLPSGKTPEEHSVYEVHAGSGKLYQRSGKYLTIYDLSHTVPSIQRRFGGKGEPVTSFARVSSSSVVAVFRDHALVYETRYGSAQQTLPLIPSQGPSQPGSKRKSLDLVQNISSFSAISYFSDIGSLVMIAGTELMIAPIVNSQKGKKAKLFHTALADIVSGLERKAPSDLHTGKKGKFKTWQNEFDTAVDQSDRSKLEQLSAHALRLKRVVTADKDDEDVDFSMNLDSASFDLEEIDRRMVLHILGRCFKPASDQEKANGIRLVVAADSTNVLKWLALTGFLTRGYIQRALFQRDPNLQSTIVPGDIMVAISRFDENFSLMFEMLALHVHWDIGEVVSALRLLAQSFETTEQGMPSTQAHASASPTENDGDDDDTPMAYGDTDINFEVETLAAEKEFDHAMTTLDTGLQVRSDAFRLTLERLHTFPSSSITTTMRSTMTHRQIIFFIHIMRIELSDGGWITRYTDIADHPSEDPDPDPDLDDYDFLSRDNRAIRAIADVLNCAIDAIGTSGWLVGLSGEGTNAAELVSALRAEINASLEGSYEASNLETMINELERYRDIARETNTLMKASTTTMTTTKTEPKDGVAEAQEAIDDEDAVLPVGLRIEVPVVVVKGGNGSGIGGGGSKKAAHIRAAERNRRVGLYSFEKIRI